MGLTCGQRVIQGFVQSVDVSKVPDPELDIVWAISPAHTTFSETCLVLWSHS